MSRSSVPFTRKKPMGLFRTEASTQPELPGWDKAERRWAFVERFRLSS